MRTIKFRAWAEKTVDNRGKYTYPKEEAELEKMAEIGEDCNRYEIREKYRKEWDKLYPEKEVYTKTKEMITNISVNSVVTRPYGYEIIEVMQFT